MYTDTHCHILSTEYDNPEEILKSLSTNNIKRIIINGYNLESNQEVIRLISKYDNVYGALGLHPDNINEESNCIKFIEENIKNPKIIAIGEIGLDYYHNKENKQEQIKLLESQLSLGEKYNLPVIIHNREATDDLIKVLKKYHTKGIIHCFNGSYETAQIFLKMGYKLGIGGIITFKSCKLKEVTAKLPKNSFFLETDAPYLTPAPYRGTPNEPKFIKFTAAMLADSLKITEKELSILLEENFQNMFFENKKIVK